MGTTRRERAAVLVRFFCACGASLEADFFNEHHKDIVHCDCGRKFIITRPFKGEIGSLYRRAFGEGTTDADA